MKIESSTIQMDAVHAISQNRRTEMNFTSSYVTASTDSLSNGSEHSGNTSSTGELIFYLNESSSYLSQTRFATNGLQEFSGERIGQFHHKLFRHIIEMMKEMLEGGNSTPFSEVSDYLTYSSQPDTSHRQTQVWYRETSFTSHLEEKENTSFRTNGLVKTSDGREISFQLKVGMSRSFIKETKLTSAETTEVLVMKDPLVINLDLPSAAVTDQEFFFDIDADGTKESLSTLSSGCGFLALDKNGDNIINDGSELFGTESGDGFADLARYDEDGNGWIDENDSIFSRLRVWTKDEDGRDQLLDLSEADVGAIFLGHVATDFHLNDAQTNETYAKIQSSGIFLHESSSEAGTIQHVDFAI